MTKKEIEQNSIDIKKLSRIKRIAARAVRLHKKLTGKKASRIQIILDLHQCIKKYPVDLSRLLKAESGNFVHDVFGIRRHLDRKTGKLTGGFLPRIMFEEGEGNG